MDYKSVLKSARENLNGSCKVCKVCNGIACSGEVQEWVEKEQV